MKTRPAAKAGLRPGGRSSRVRTAVMAAARAEFLAVGFAQLSLRAVALRAGVNPTTVYRRWPSRERLLLDLMLEIAGEQVPVPETGTLIGDFEAYLERISVALTDPATLIFIRSVLAAFITEDTEMRAAISEFWATRFAGAFVILDRAVSRGEVSTSVERERVVELLVAPMWFRALVSGAPLDAAFRARSANDAFNASQNHKQKI